MPIFELAFTHFEYDDYYNATAPSLDDIHGFLSSLPRLREHLCRILTVNRILVLGYQIGIFSIVLNWVAHLRVYLALWYWIIGRCTGLTKTWMAIWV